MNELVVVTKSIILFNKRALIIQRSEYDAVGEGDWEFVGGGLEFGETLIDCLKREIMEEVRLTVQIDRLLFASTVKLNDHRQIVFLTYLSHADTEAVHLSHEHKDYLWASKEQIIKLLNKPLLNDLIENKVLDSLDIV